MDNFQETVKYVILFIVDQSNYPGSGQGGDEILKMDTQKREVVPMLN